MSQVGWEALGQGDDVARIEPIAGGVANDVWKVAGPRVRVISLAGGRALTGRT